MPTRASKKLRPRAPAPTGLSPLLPVAFVFALSSVWSAAVARQVPPPEAGAAGAPAPPTTQATPPPAEAPGAGEPGEGGSAPEAAPSQLPPELQSPYVVRVYKVRPAKLFKGLLESLKADGYPPEEVDEEKRIVKTSFVDFKQDDYELQVAEPPPQLGGAYHILQMIKVRGGKVSLEGVVAPGKDGTELKVRARILVGGLDRIKRVHVLVDRRSTGVIESDFVHKLEARMGLEHR